MPVWSQDSEGLVENQTVLLEQILYLCEDSLCISGGLYPFLQAKCFRNGAFLCGLTKRMSVERNPGSFLKWSNQDFDPYFFEIQPSSGLRWSRGRSITRKRSQEKSFMREGGIWSSGPNAGHILMIKMVTDCSEAVLPSLMLLIWLRVFSLQVGGWQWRIVPSEWHGWESVGSLVGRWVVG